MIYARNRVASVEDQSELLAIGGKHFLDNDMDAAANMYERAVDDAEQSPTQVGLGDDRLGRRDRQSDGERQALRGLPVVD